MDSMPDDQLDTFDIVLALLYAFASKNRGVSQKQIHIALFLASKRIERFNKLLEFIPL